MSHMPADHEGFIHCKAKLSRASYDEISVWQELLTAKKSVGLIFLAAKIRHGDYSMWRNLDTANIPPGDNSYGKNLIGNKSYSDNF